MVWQRLIVAAFVAALLPAPSVASFLGFGKKKVERVPVVPAPPVLQREPRPEPPLAGRDKCVDISRVAAAQVFGDTSVELTLQGGARWRMYFAQGCPTLDFYRGFYYRRAEQGRLCAGRDAVIMRAGGECAIVSIVPHAKPVSKRKRHRRR